MRQTAPIREYRRKPLRPEMREKLDRCRLESQDLAERELLCPYCGWYLMTVFSDASGHLKSHCKKCKTVTIFNLGCFRRIHRGRRN